MPALVSLLATPYILYKLYPPEIKDTPDAPAMAAKRLEVMGPVTKNELVMIGTMLLAVSLWIFGYVLLFSIELVRPFSVITLLRYCYTNILGWI